MQYTPIHGLFDFDPYNLSEIPEILFSKSWIYFNSSIKSTNRIHR